MFEAAGRLAAQAGQWQAHQVVTRFVLGQDAHHALEHHHLGRGGASEPVGRTLACLAKAQRCVARGVAARAVGAGAAHGGYCRMPDEFSGTRGQQSQAHRLG